MKVLCDNGFFSSSDLNLITDAVAQVSELLVAPHGDTGELVIAYRLEGHTTWHEAYRATLDGGCGGSCATNKVATLIVHREVNCTGHLREADLKEGEVCYYGANRLFRKLNRRKNNRIIDPYDPKTHAEKHFQKIEFIVAFSGWKEWQDEFYVAAVREVFDSIVRISDDFSAPVSPDDLDDDPVVGTARNIVRNLLSLA